MTRNDGDWIATYSGGKFWPLDPTPGDVSIYDIAHALGMLCRYNGHVRSFYSVAEHSILMCQYLDSIGESIYVQAHALLHDAAEAYLSDVPRPVKPYLSGFKLAECRIELVIQDAFGMSYWDRTHDAVKAVDTRILCDESAVLMSDQSRAWHAKLGPPLDVTIQCWTPGQAEERFKSEFFRLLSLGAFGL